MTRCVIRRATLLLALVVVLLAGLPAAAEVLRFSTPEGTPRFENEPFELALGMVATLEFVLLLFLLGPRTWRGVAPHLARSGPGPAWRELLGLLGLTVAAFLVRVLVAEPAPILSTFNDVKHAHDAMCLSGTAHACDLTYAYPLGLTAIHGLVFRVFGPSLAATYWTNAVIGTLAVPAIWLGATLLLGGRRSAGWLAAAALAGLPLHIRFAASGAHTTAFVTFATVGLAGFLLFARSRRPRHLWLGTVAFALAVQCRFEAVAFGAPLLLATLFAAPGFWRAAVAPGTRWHALAAAAVLLATAATPLWHAVQPDVSIGFGGATSLHVRLALVLALPLVWVGLGHVLDRLPGARYLRWAAGLAFVAGAYALGGVYELLPRSLLPSPGAWLVFEPDGLHLPSFADRGLPLLNPRAVTLPALALLLVGVAGGLERERRGPVAVWLTWWGLAATFGLQKFTGELPFEHLRTAVDGVPAVAGLAACGGLALVDLLPRRDGARLRAAAAGLLAAFLLSGPLFSLPMLRARGYDNERQIAFLQRTIPPLPHPAVVVYPNATLPGQHPFAELFRIPEVWWTLGHMEADRQERFVGTRAALAAPAELVALAEQGWTLLYWEGVDCYRTAGAPDERRADCDEMHWTFALTPLAEETIPVRPFESDFTEHYLVTTEEVTLRVYRIDGLQK